jgi:hypothetical protein
MFRTVYVCRVLYALMYVPQDEEGSAASSAAGAFDASLPPEMLCAEVDGA